jgi:hypothetical protein|tara:strand:- start:129 stop:1034 length:906 start_codon:yes stop_codon:yes gene_type:complete
MKIKLSILFILVSSISLAEAVLANSDEELQTNNSPGCLTLLEAETDITPPELAMGLLDCAKSNDVKNAHDLFLIMMVRSIYDSKRVDDLSAGAAVNALKNEVFWQIDSDFFDRMAEFQNSVDQPYYDNICVILKNKGAPDYYPRYMVLHGINAITGISGDGLKQNFDEENEWINTVDNRFSCSSPGAPDYENTAINSKCKKLCDSSWWETATFSQVIEEWEVGADLNWTDAAYGRTPLHWAAAFGAPETIKALLGVGANVLAKDKDGKTPSALARKNPALSGTTAMEMLRQATFKKMRSGD